MTDITAVGELLIDFTEAGLEENGRRLFEQNPGGAPANLLTLAARLGFHTAFAGKVGRDMHGIYLKSVLEHEGIDTRGLILSDEAFTTLAFVALSEAGERTFSFARKPGADTLLRKDELPLGLLRDTRILHFGSLSLTDEPARSATLFAVETAKRSGALISYDPNYRAPLWKSRSEAVDRMRSVLPLVDIFKLSEDEAALLSGKACPEDAAHALSHIGIPCIAVTLGAQGALVCIHGEIRHISAPPVSVTDTTGAGDAFFGGFLCRLLQLGHDMQDLRPDDGVSAARWGCAAAACCIQKRGGIPAMPTLSMLKRYL